MASRCSSVHKKRASQPNPSGPKPTTNTFHSKTPRLHYITVHLSSVGAHKDVKLASSAYKRKRSLQDDKETEDDDERGGLDVDDGKTKTLSMRSTEKRCRSGAGKKPLSKRWIRRRRFSSPFSSDKLDS